MDELRKQGRGRIHESLDRVFSANFKLCGSLER